LARPLPRRPITGLRAVAPDPLELSIKTKERVMRRTLYLLLALALAPAAQADTLDLKLNDSMAELTYGTGAENIGLQEGDIGIGFMFNEESDLVGTLSFQSIGRVDDALSFALGVKTYIARLDGPRENLLALAVGGGIGYTLPGTPLTASASGFIAPSILTFGDAERVRELNVRLQAQLLPNAAVFVGWRELRTRLDEGRGDYKVDDDFHVGVKLAF
jgi:hypothetical protein